MPEVNSGEIAVPRLASTDRLVSLAPLHLVDARNGAAPTLATAVRLGRRDDRLLVRFDCRHRGVVATLREGNADLWTEDVVEAFLCPGDSPYRYLELEVNPLGARFSAIVDSPNLSREGMTVEKFPFLGFQADVHVREQRWSARLSVSISEMRQLLAPRAGLRDPEGKRTADEGREGSASGAGSREASGRPEAFRANFFRIDRTSGEFSALFPALADPPDFHVPGKFGRFRLAP